MEVIDFHRSDIYEEEMIERVQAANDAVGDYYDKMLASIKGLVNIIIVV